MQRIDLFTWLTNGYASGWDHLNQHEFLTTAKATPMRQTRAPEGYDDGGTAITFVTVPSGAGRRDSRVTTAALYHFFSGSNCRHEYDCCGCASRRADVRRHGRNTYRVAVTTSYNY